MDGFGGVELSDLFDTGTRPEYLLTQTFRVHSGKSEKSRNSGKVSGGGVGMLEIFPNLPHHETNPRV